MRQITRLAALALCLSAAPALAGEAWDGLRAQLWGDRPIAEGGAVLTLDAPARATDDRRVPVGAHVALPDGATLKSLTLIIDENPMPVSAVFEAQTPATAFSTEVALRLNGPSEVRAVAEDDQGRLWMVGQMVKTSGLGACAAPPTTDPKLALDTLGQMDLAVDTGDALRARMDPSAEALARLSISHPSHSGLQMDQITLLFTPARYVETVEVWADDAPAFTVTGSISLAENPEIAFTAPAGAHALRVRMTDTDGAVFERRFGLGAS
jgi:sulfur-oxidizing protein SoxY